MLRVVALLLLVVGAAADGMAPPDGASSLEMYVDQLPQMPKMYGYNATTANLTVGMFQIKWKFHRDLPPTTVFAFGTSAEAAAFPGPTIEALQGVPLHVTWENHLPSRHFLPWDATVPVAVPKHGGVPTVVHLHGGVHPPQSDGSAMAWFTAGFNETGAMWSAPSYTYPNAQGPGVLWYHDHALGLTRVNLLAGLLGAYIIRNPAVEAPLGLPSGDDFDRVLVLADRSFNADGSIYMNSTGDNPGTHPQWRMEYFGDAITVNGKAWPFLSVARRRYRFRIINACNARYFNLSFTNGLAFHVVGSDASYLPRPVTTAHLLVAVAEAFDVVVDFAEAGGSAAAVEMVNTAPYPYPGGDAPNKINGKVMKFVFVVTQNMTSTDNSTVPAKLLEYVKVSVEEAVQRRYIVLSPYGSGTRGMGGMAPMPGMGGMAPMPGMGDMQGMGGMPPMPDMGRTPPMPGMGGMVNPLQLYINGKRPEDPVTETPRTGTTEVWEVINLTPEDHPIHLHLASIQAVRARGIKQLEEFTHCVTMLNDAEMCNVSQHAVGEVVEVPEHERSWKNVAKIAPGYMTTLVVKFFLVETGQPYPFDATADPGYVYHCHILDHEDNAMVRPLKLIKSGGTSGRDRRHDMISPLYIYLSIVMVWYCFQA